MLTMYQTLFWEQDKNLFSHRIYILEEETTLKKIDK